MVSTVNAHVIKADPFLCFREFHIIYLIHFVTVSQNNGTQACFSPGDIVIIYNVRLFNSVMILV